MKLFHIVETTVTIRTSTTSPSAESTVASTGSTVKTSATDPSTSSAPILSSTLLSTTVATSESTTLGRTSTLTTTKRCEEMQAVDEETSKKIIVKPVDVPEKEKPDFQPTSNTGISFAEYDRRPTIVVPFGTPAEVQSVTIPRDKTPNANVERFQVTFYAPEGNKINDRPIPSSSSPKDDKSKPSTVDFTQIPSNRLVSRVEITITDTTNEQSPKGVVLDIKACTEMTTGK